MAREVSIPDGDAAEGDGAIEVCFMCAHYRIHHAGAVKEHGIMGALDRDGGGRRLICACSKAEIYPADVVSAADAACRDYAASHAPAAPTPELTPRERFEDAAAGLRGTIGDGEAAELIERVLRRELLRRAATPRKRVDAPGAASAGRGAGVHAARLEAPEAAQADAGSLTRVRRVAGRVQDR